MTIKSPSNEGEGQFDGNFIVWEPSTRALCKFDADLMRAGGAFTQPRKACAQGASLAPSWRAKARAGPASPATSPATKAPGRSCVQRTHFLS